MTWPSIFMSLAVIAQTTSDTYMSTNCFVSQVQQATYYWAELLQSTGGKLKPEKCFWYHLSYKFGNSEPMLQKIKDLPRLALAIPQPQNQDAHIQLKDIDQTSETLGICTTPLPPQMMGGVKHVGSKQLQKLLERGHEWTCRISCRHLPT